MSTSQQPSERRARRGYPWLLPSTLLDADAPDTGGRPVRRTVRDWAVDIACFLLAVAFSLVMAAELYSLDLPRPLLIADQVVGALACAAIWLRRRWPLALCLVLTPLSVLFPMAAGATLVALFTVTVHRPFPLVALAGAVNLLAGAIGPLIRPDQDFGFGFNLALGAVITLTVIGWGMFVRARRQLVLSYRERARRAETEANLRAAQAQQEARTQIAREMHDVLGHRLSLLSVHAGALEFRPDAPPEDVAKAAGVIRASAHQAMQDLREVIGVLRAPVGTDGPAPGTAVQGDERPQPDLRALGRLVEESRQAGMRVALTTEVGAESGRSGTGETESETGAPAAEVPEIAVPEAIGRTAYRIVQEGLTNARKHAPGGAVAVTVAGSPGDGLRLELRNPTAPARTASARTGPAPGDGQAHGRGRDPGQDQGQGLIGLAERAALAGGRIEHEVTGSGDFVLTAWLPWPP
ncbi:signal transduction histidine kinase [Murinocardiopsis flavida]|uniref:histidine kinase n=1 Tax=Murinocardiopsis flavida TaxID=645275 RepID=A0A2P8DU72_9ACTN|nr:histidine kinase [Murinocardiopsis flavida]PSL00770.1 signal transduction histidine kinase [Murinocardiopsis flavida]